MLIRAFIANLHDLDRSPNTIRTRTFYLDSFRAFTDPGTATAAEIRAWIAAHPHWSESTRHTAISSVRAMYRWAKDEGLIDRDPALRIENPRPVKVHRPVVDEVSLKRAMHAATLTERVLLRLGAECGLRVHEMVKTHTDDFIGAMLSVVGKGRKIRRLYASPELRAEVLELVPTGGWLFPSRIGHKGVEWAYDRIVALTGYPPHALRRRAASAVYKGSGHDIRLTQTFLGHADVSTTMLYLGVEMDDLERASGFTRIAA